PRRARERRLLLRARPPRLRLRLAPRDVRLERRLQPVARVLARRAAGGFRGFPVHAALSTWDGATRPDRVPDAARLRLRGGEIASNTRPTKAGCSSSEVEHSLGKGEVESSILSCSTTPIPSGSTPPAVRRSGRGEMCVRALAVMRRRCLPWRSAR